MGVFGEVMGSTPKMNFVLLSELNCRKTGRKNIQGKNPPKFKNTPKFLYEYAHPLFKIFL